MLLDFSLSLSLSFHIFHSLALGVLEIVFSKILFLSNKEKTLEDYWKSYAHAFSFHTHEIKLFKLFWCLHPLDPKVKCYLGRSSNAHACRSMYLDMLDRIEMSSY